MGLGIGAGLGFMMPGMIAQGMKGQSAPVAEALRCPHCHVDVSAEAHFCGSCGARVDRGVECPGCHAALPSGAKFCMSCGRKTDESGK